MIAAVLATTVFAFSALWFSEWMTFPDYLACLRRELHTGRLRIWMRMGVYSVIVDVKLVCWQGFRVFISLVAPTTSDMHKARASRVHFNIAVAVQSVQNRRRLD